MKDQKSLQLTLKTEIQHMERALHALSFSQQKAANIDFEWLNAALQLESQSQILSESVQEEKASGNDRIRKLEALETLEALCSRFARASDIFIVKLLRLTDELDLEQPGTLRDRINRAASKGILLNVDEIIQIRSLRNEISHDYLAEAVPEMSKQVLTLSPVLHQVFTRYCSYMDKYLT